MREVYLMSVLVLLSLVLLASLMAIIQIQQEFFNEKIRCHCSDAAFQAPEE